MHIDDETLMAFADGALPADTARRVEAAVAADPALATRLRAFGGARAAVAALPLPAAPAGLEAHIRALAAAAAVPKPVEAASSPVGENVIPLRRPRAPVWHMPLAAAASLVLGLFLAPLLMPAAEEGGGLSPRIAAALDSQPAGEARDGISIIASFEDGTGALCREYETEALTGIACRQEQGWQMRLAVAAGASDGYVPASSLEVIDAWMVQNDAGAPMDPDAEAAALQAR